MEILEFISDDTTLFCDKINFTINHKDIKDIYNIEFDYISDCIVNDTNVFMLLKKRLICFDLKGNIIYSVEVPAVDDRTKSNYRLMLVNNYPTIYCYHKMTITLYDHLSVFVLKLKNNKINLINLNGNNIVLQYTPEQVYTYKIDFVDN